MWTSLTRALKHRIYRLGNTHLNQRSVSKENAERPSNLKLRLLEYWMQNVSALLFNEWQMLLNECSGLTLLLHHLRYKIFHIILLCNASKHAQWHNLDVSDNIHQIKSSTSMAGGRRRWTRWWVGHTVPKGFGWWWMEGIYYHKAILSRSP